MGEVGNSVTKEVAAIFHEPEPTQLTPLDWTVSFNRSGLHLSNQLRGKRFPSDQLVMFDDSMNRFPVDVQEQARAAGINLIGFDFTVPQQQAFEAALFLINASGRKSQIRIKPQDWIHAYQLRSYEHGEGYQFKSQKQREDAFKALLVLGMKPFLMHYHKMEGKREFRETRIAPLWRLGFTHAASVPEAKRIEDVTTDYISKADWFELNFDKIWFDQLDNFYIYKPRNLFERIRLSLPGPFVKIPASLHPFLEWVFAEAGRLRTQQKDESREHPTYMLKADWREVAMQSRLHRQFEKRNSKRAREMLTHNADLAQKAGILDTFRFEGNLFIAAVNPVQFDELEEYLQDRRRQPAKIRSKAKTSDQEAPPWKPEKLSPNQVKELVKEWRNEKDRLRSKPVSEINAKQIGKLTQWIKAYEDVLYGRG